jgi:hypothetical protein
LGLLVALVGIGITVGWIVFGSKSPERFAPAEAARVAASCTSAQAALQALPDSFPRTGADRVARIRAEDTILRDMVARIRSTHVSGATPASAVQGWATDWSRVIDARERYASDLESVKGTDKTVKFVLPATNSVKPVTTRMDDFVRENHPNLDACFTDGLQLETVEGPRVYKKLTSD